MSEPERDIQDLIIIRRRASAEAEQVKGGVWKIAFADFMTAMMCFFLVMWLINAANEDTRQAVASYFNPMRLAELNRKGIADPHVTGINTPQRGDPAVTESEIGGSKAGDATAEHSRDALFRDPYGVLSEIAGEATQAETQSSEDVASALPAAATGSFRDPFDPKIEKLEPTAGAAPEEGRQREAETMQESAADEAPRQALPGEATLSTPEAAEISPAGDAVPMSFPPRAPLQPDIGLAAAPTPPPQTAAASERMPEIERQIAEATEGGGSGRSPKIAVERTDGGVLISLTDEAEFGMFAIGSAEPQPQLVRIMQRIAEILTTRDGDITIRGHTDGRPFRSGNYDNWRLSTDRAQMAYYMLVRGGLDERRVAAIEGYADRKLKVPEDPEAAENRRIEIFLREDTL